MRHAFSLHVKVTGVYANARTGGGVKGAQRATRNTGVTELRSQRQGLLERQVTPTRRPPPTLPVGQ